MGGFVNFEGIFSFYGFSVSLKLIFKLIFNGRTPTLAYAIRGVALARLGEVLLRYINFFPF